MAAPDLGKMVGPLPLGAWLAAGGVGIGAGIYLNVKRKSAANAAAGASVLDTTALGPKGTVAVVPNGGILLPNGAQAPSGAGTNTDTTSNKPTDNMQWSQLALQTLLASGYNAGAVAAALANYLGGQPLDPQQRAIIDLAIAKVGLPPNPVPLVPSNGTPPATPTAGGSFVYAGRTYPTSSQYEAALARLLGGDWSMDAFDAWRSAGGSVNDPRFGAVFKAGTPAGDTFVRWASSRKLWPFAK